MTDAIQDLVAQAACFACLPPHHLEVAELQTWLLIAAVLGEAVTIDDLLAQAACFHCLPDGILEVLEVVTLNTILEVAA